MAPEKKDKKRKATAAAAVTATDLPNKKSKKTSSVEQTPPAVPKSILKKKDSIKEVSNGISKSTVPETAGSEPARKVKPRKRASDFLSDEEDNLANEEEVKTAKSKSDKKSKDKSEKKDAPSEKTKKAKIVEKIVEDESDGSDEDDEASAGEDEVDDQTAELIKGFESSGDEDASGDEGFDADKSVPRIPDSKKAKRKIQKKLKENTQADEPGTVYVGRIPHGFYEHQMRAYFSQFGDITRLRLSRNRVTGRSKHYAFIEFASSVVAKIVAETMNNYLMYGHILKCKFVPQEQQHAELWKGSNRRYKQVPWNRIEKRRLEQGKTREKWAKSIKQEGQRRAAKAEKLKELLGYEYEAPTLKAVDVVPVQEKLPAPEAEAAEQDSSAKGTTELATLSGDSDKKEVENDAVVDEQTPKKKSKKAKKEVSGTPDVKTTPAKVTGDEKTTPVATPESSTKKDKTKKAKKSAGKA